MADPTEIDEELLSEIRRAAFELRHREPQEAVRVLRRAAGKGGAAEVLARGALGEIYLEELGDLDGAEHEFRRVLELAPMITAAELGLARVRREQGRTADADASYLRAVKGLERDLQSFREAGQTPPGAEEVALTLLEVALELAELRGGKTAPALDESLLAWAAETRLFDAIAAEEEADPEAARDDWARFHAGWARLSAIAGKAGEAVARLRNAERDEHLSHAAAARLLRDACEDAGDLRAAAEEGQRLLQLSESAPAEDVLRAAALLAASGDEPEASRVLTDALPRFTGDDKKLLEAALQEPGPKLVTLGKKK